MVLLKKLTPLRNILLLILPFVIMMALTTPVSASATSRIRNLMYYYQYYQDDAQVDIDRLLDELAKIDPDQADKWDRIMDFWSWMNRDMETNPGCLPDGLPDDDSLCIVVLGYGLEADGSMKPELIGRLETALRSAEKYPNAYILCSGGAARARVTESEQMSKWLMEQGIEESRIILEPYSYSTAMNARYSIKILREEYPQIRSLALVTSDYHIRRGALVFYGEAVLTDSGLELVGNAIYVANRNVNETYTYQAYEISRLAPVGYQENGPRPNLSRLERITARCEGPCEAGHDFPVTVTAHYNNKYTRDVTADAVYSGVNVHTPGVQTVTVSYTWGGITCTTEVEMEVVISEIEPVIPETVPETEPVPTETVPATTEAMEVSEKPITKPMIPLVIAMGAVVLLLFGFRKRR